MPEELKKFIESLNTDQADKLWLYLDNNPEAVNEMIILLLQSYGNIEASYKE